MIVAEPPVATSGDASSDRRVYLLLAALCFAAYLPQAIAVCCGAWPVGDDALAAIAPWRELTLNALHHGVLPLWNPHVFCGMAFIGTGQSGVFYPPNLVYWLLPMKLALLVDALGHNVLLVCGTYKLARALPLSRSAAWIAAVAGGLGSAVSSHLFAGHMNWHAARAYQPWELWLTLEYLRTGDKRYSYVLAVVVALQTAAGYPPAILLSVGLCLGLVLAWLVARTTERLRTAVRASPQRCVLPRGWGGALITAASLIVLLTAVQVLPLRELSRLTMHGAGLTFQDATAFSATWRTFFKLLTPGFFGGTGDLQWGTLGEAHEEAAYIGLLPTVLALAAPWLARTRSCSSHVPRAVWWLWALLPFTVVLALGDHTPVYRLLFTHLALLRTLRLPTRWLALWCVAGPLLAGYSFDGCRDALAGAAPRLARLVTSMLWTLAGCFLLLAVVVTRMAPSAPLWTCAAARIIGRVTTGDQLNVASVAAGFRMMAMLESFTVCLLAALAASLWRRWCEAGAPLPRRRVETLILSFVALDVLFSFWRYPHIVTAQHDQQYLSWPRDLTRLYRPDQRWSTRVIWVAVNRGEPAGIDLVNGYDPMSTQRYFAFAQAVEGRVFWDGVYQPEHYPPLLRVAGVTHTLSQSGIPLGTDSTSLIPVAISGDWALWRQPDPWPRVYLTRRVLHVSETAQLSLLNALASRDFHTLGQPAVAAPMALSGIADLPLTTTDRVLSWRREQNWMTVRTVTSAPTVLVQSETWFPGWRAWVNGHPARLERVNFLFRGVEVPSGGAVVQAVYDPAAYRCALFLTLCGMAAATLLATTRLRRVPQAAKAASQ